MTPKNIKKTAFTLAETITAFVIIGVLSLDVIVFLYHYFLII